MSKLEVLHDYGGRPTGERRIAPGVYDADDPRLLGQADYLVAQGHARPLESEPEPEPESDEDHATEDEASVYDSLIVADLTAEMEQRGISLKAGAGSGANGAWLKSDLIAALEQDDAEIARQAQAAAAVAANEAPPAADKTE